MDPSTGDERIILTAESISVSTDADLVDPTALAVRPQPLGAFPLPLGYMLIPVGPDTEEARLALLAGRCPSGRRCCGAHELALAGDRDGALAALSGDDPVSRYNRFVMDPDSGTPTSCVRRWAISAC